MTDTAGPFSPRVLVLMVIGIAVNIGLGQTVSTLNLPVFLDSLGTMVVAVMAGPVAGLLTGLLSNLIWGLLVEPVAAAFAPVAALIGLVAGLLARAGFWRNIVMAAIAGVIIAALIPFVAVPIRIWMFGGVTGNGADFLTAWLLQSGQSLFSSTLVTVITSNLADKVVTAVLAFIIIRGLPLRMTSDWPFMANSRV